MEYEVYEEIAASMFGGDPGLLNYKLCESLSEVARLTEVAGGDLRSRQVIAAIVVDWLRRNPDKRVYGE